MPSLGKSTQKKHQNVSVILQVNVRVEGINEFHMILQKQLKLLLKRFYAAASFLLTTTSAYSGTLYLNCSSPYRTASLFAERHGGGVQTCEITGMCTQHVHKRTK
jgi:hypothetical protein